MHTRALVGMDVRESFGDAARTGKSLRDMNAKVNTHGLD